MRTCPPNKEIGFNIEYIIVLARDFHYEYYSYKYIQTFESL